jgi:hypothetical protein
MIFIETTKSQPVKTSALLLALLLPISGALAVDLDLGTQSGGSPYDRYMGPVKTVLNHVNGAPASASMDSVRQLMRVGRSFRYAFDTPYVANMPGVTAARKAGDCKDKALWLASQLNDSSVRFVIGKSSSRSRISHAWLYWKDSSNKWWILDCTNKSRPIPADRVSRNSYIPFYSYAKGSVYRHDGALRFAAESGIASASRKAVASHP